MNTKRTLPVGLALVVLLVAGSAFVHVGSAASPRRGFTARVDNPWYPLKPGTVYRYRGVKERQPSREVMTVTRRTKVIDGAPCVVVDDRLYLHGRLEERTIDWYTQDAKGNVWYFGEKTAELDSNGRVKTTAGSWTAGVNGARPGIFMFARPKPGRWARQEYYKGRAEDHFKVLNLHVSVSTPYISSSRAMLTKEWTPLEPGVVDHKYYVRGIGTVLEQTAKGPEERNELVSFRRGT
jgi:hypothetical protein